MLNLLAFLVFFSFTAFAQEEGSTHNTEDLAAKEEPSSKRQKLESCPHGFMPMEDWPSAICVECAVKKPCTLEEAEEVKIKREQNNECSHYVNGLPANFLYSEGLTNAKPPKYTRLLWPDEQGEERPKDKKTIDSAKIYLHQQNYNVFDIEKILDHRQVDDGSIRYLVQWKNHPKGLCGWEHEDSILQHLKDRYWRRQKASK